MGHSRNWDFLNYNSLEWWDMQIYLHFCSSELKKNFKKWNKILLICNFILINEENHGFYQLYVYVIIISLNLECFFIKERV